MFKLLIKASVVFLVVLIISSVFFSNPFTSQKLNLNQNHDVPDILFHEKCLYPTVKVCDKQETSGGTGFITRSMKQNDKYYNIVLCAAHVIAPLEQIKICVANYKNFSQVDSFDCYDAVLYASNTKLDLAIICFISDRPMYVVDLDFQSNLYLNTTVFRIGFGGLEDPRLDYGNITQPLTRTDTGLIRTNVFTIMGDSGGPLFLSKNYKVIGVAHKIKTFKGNLLPNISYYVPVSSFSQWNSEMEGAFNFVYLEEQLPVYPFKLLILKEYF
jgi:hypothetical protein